MMSNSIVLGVDIGGSHITAKLVDLEKGLSINQSEVREAVKTKGTTEEIINTWCQVISRAFGSLEGAKKIGIAMPGPFDYKKGISWMKDQDKYDALYGLNIRELIAKEISLSANDIKFINDAESFLKGEVFSGAAKDSCTAIGLTLGTGLGSAYYSDAQVKDADLWRSPFKDGIAEDYLSTRWFTRRYAEIKGSEISGVKELVSYSTDAAVAEIFNEFGTNLGLFLSEMTAKNKAEVIVIGGNIAQAFRLFQKNLLVSLGNGAEHAVVKRALLGEEASLIGAASCWQPVKQTVQTSARA